MTWIKTVSMKDDERVKSAMLAQRAVYPSNTPPPCIQKTTARAPASSHRIP